MIAFLKDMVAALKEGAAEGIIEANQEIEAEKAVKAAATAQEIAALRKRAAVASPMERIVTALAGPYRETFLDELGAAKAADRPPVYLLCMDLSSDEHASWKKLLKRDFDIDDGADAERLAAALVEAAQTFDGDAAAVALTRACHIAAGAAGVGYVDVAQAVGWVASAIPTAAGRFGSWSAFGEAFLRGERGAAGSNVLGRKFLTRGIRRLQDDPASPWQTITWPAHA
jgi:hypothetical protein